MRGVFVASQAAAAHLPQGGRIINIGSVNADNMPFAGGSVYALSKGAVASFTRGLARDLGPRGITVNNVQPGPVDTDLNPANGPHAEGLTKIMALGRYGRAEEVAGSSPTSPAPTAATSPERASPSTAASTPDLRVRGRSPRAQCILYLHTKSAAFLRGAADAFPRFGGNRRLLGVQAGNDFR